MAGLSENAWGVWTKIIVSNFFQEKLKQKHL